MKDVLQAAIDRAEAQIARAQDWIDLRISVYRRVNLLPRDRLVRLVKVLADLAPDELDAALGYAEGLAAWSQVSEQSADATLTQGGSEAAPAGGTG